MKKIFIKLCMYFCLFMLLGSLFTIPQMISVSKSSAQTIAIFVPLFIFGFGDLDAVPVPFSESG